jgi:hypothetical protein
VARAILLAGVEGAAALAHRGERHPFEVVVKWLEQDLSSNRDALRVLLEIGAHIDRFRREAWNNTRSGTAKKPRRYSK